VREVAALFVRVDSHYKAMPGVDAYDHKRDTLTWTGGVPAVYHPPCRAWGKYKAVAKPRPGEKALALWSMEQCRKFGGVIAHPISSGLWKAAGCLSWGVRDQFGGVLITVKQGDFGHRAEKATGLYIVGAPVPDLPEQVGNYSHYVESMGKTERERTPEKFAKFLVEIARAVR
jgi:hypothetical protein